MPSGTGERDGDRHPGMIRLTILFDAPHFDGSLDLEGRERHRANALARRCGATHGELWCIQTAWPGGSVPPHRLMATFEWEDRDGFDRGATYHGPERALTDTFGPIQEPVYLVTEVASGSGREGGET